MIVRITIGCLTFSVDAEIWKNREVRVSDDASYISLLYVQFDPFKNDEMKPSYRLSFGVILEIHILNLLTTTLLASLPWVIWINPSSFRGATYILSCIGGSILSTSSSKKLFHKYLCCHLRRHYSQLESVVIELRTCIGVCCCTISVQMPKTVFCYTSRKVVKILEQVLDVCNNFKIIYVVHSFSNRFDCHMSYPAMQTVYNSYLMSSSISWSICMFLYSNWTSKNDDGSFIVNRYLFFCWSMIVTEQSYHIIKLKSNHFIFLQKFAYIKAIYILRLYNFDMFFIPDPEIRRLIRISVDSSSFSRLWSCGFFL